jgi:predicted MFS family arabinose efflux permease
LTPIARELAITEGQAGQALDLPAALLENVTGFDVSLVSVHLYDVGFSGLIVTLVIGYLLRSHLLLAIVGLPAGMAEWRLC